MALRLHVDAAVAVHAEGVLDAVDVLGGRQQADHVGAAEDQRLAVPPALVAIGRFYDGSYEWRWHRAGVSRPRATAPRGSSATSRRSPARRTRSRARRSAATPTRPTTATRSTTSRRALRASSASTVSEDPVGTLVARNRPPRRAGLRDRLALRLEPERRQVRRHDGRRHGARGLPAERRARARPAAAADLLPRGGGLGLRADAARQPDHRAARHRGGAARARSARSTTAAASGSTPRRPATSPSAGASRSTCSTT